ncbi:Uncharacterized membrane protein YdjX, TVP38/TMEM64 family, SNARE-associated domain [Catalinimonas alkaloidigena]|uniref:TVP38/TMEM64 family membrane protein n=1 Tax=Catalinimonas alkaloidigena TaxID=1075417 RepID=A0A1G9MW11_9BACT|nr:VTT domain-containing protein [Catalinimonas alkaloidigena]SDL78314.1 Uncharacterized membrane protein YdjX, TVP38/TMEM64 family, SNARE-associated domain [Catalinimonas alkaloidigena]
MHRIFSFLRTNRAAFYWMLWLSVAPLLVSSVLVVGAIQYETQVADFSTWTWSGVFAAFALSMALGVTPTTFIALLTGYFLGFQALLGSVPAYTIAAWLGYLVARQLDGGTFLQSLHQFEKVQRTLQMLRADNAQVVVLARLSPVLPFAVMNVLFAMLRMRLRTVLLAGTVGMLPRTVLMTAIGQQAFQLRNVLEEGGGVTERVVVVALVLFSLVGLTFYIRRAMKKATSAER